MVTNVESQFTDFKQEIRKEFAGLKSTNEQLYNHLSTRLPAWGTVIISILTGLLTGFIGLGIGSL